MLKVRPPRGPHQNLARKCPGFDTGSRDRRKTKEHGPNTKLNEYKRARKIKRKGAAYHQRVEGLLLFGPAQHDNSLFLQ